jgi:hypothetical protein
MTDDMLKIDVVLANLKYQIRNHNSIYWITGPDGKKFELLCNVSGFAIASQQAMIDISITDYQTRK